MVDAVQLDVGCRQVVEMVTDYLEGTLSPESTAALEAHLRECDGCIEYVEQVQATIAATRLAAAAVNGGTTLDDERRQQLLAAFRDLTPRAPADSD